MYSSARPLRCHHSRTWTKPLREAPSIASAEYFFVRNEGDVFQKSRISVRPKTDEALSGREGVAERAPEEILVGCLEV